MRETYAEFEARIDRERRKREREYSIENWAMMGGGLAGGVVATLVLTLVLWPHLYITSEFMAALLGLCAAAIGLAVGGAGGLLYIAWRKRRARRPEPTK